MTLALPWRPLEPSRLCSVRLWSPCPRDLRLEPPDDRGRLRPRRTTPAWQAARHDGLGPREPVSRPGVASRARSGAPAQAGRATALGWVVAAPRRRC